MEDIVTYPDSYSQPVVPVAVPDSLDPSSIYTKSQTAWWKGSWWKQPKYLVIIVVVAAVAGMSLWWYYKKKNKVSQENVQQESGANGTGGAGGANGSTLKPKIIRYARDISEIYNVEWKPVKNGDQPTIGITFTRVPGSDRGMLKTWGNQTVAGSWIDHPTPSDLNIKVFDTPYTVKADTIFKTDNGDTIAFRKDGDGYLTVTTGYEYPTKPGETIKEQVFRLAQVEQ